MRPRRPIEASAGFVYFSPARDEPCPTPSQGAGAGCMDGACAFWLFLVGFPCSPRNLRNGHSNQGFARLCSLFSCLPIRNGPIIALLCAACLHQIGRRGWTQVETAGQRVARGTNEPVLCTVYSTTPQFLYDTIQYEKETQSLSRSNQVRHWDIPEHMKRRNPVARQSAQDPAGTWAKGICFSSPLLGCNRDASRTGVRRYQCSRYCLSKSAALALLEREREANNRSITGPPGTYMAESLITCTSTLTATRTQSNTRMYCMAT
ncbi:hypothetical protein V8C34DRAFT_280973 [Trichoderma compactum]